MGEARKVKEIKPGKLTEKMTKEEKPFISQEVIDRREALQRTQQAESILMDFEKYVGDPEEVIKDEVKFYGRVYEQIDEAIAEQASTGSFEGLVRASVKEACKASNLMMNDKNYQEYLTKLFLDDRSLALKHAMLLASEHKLAFTNNLVKKDFEDSLIFASQRHGIKGAEIRKNVMEQRLNDLKMARSVSEMDNVVIPIALMGDKDFALKVMEFSPIKASNDVVFNTELTNDQEFMGIMDKSIHKFIHESLSHGMLTSLTTLLTGINSRMNDFGGKRGEYRDSILKELEEAHDEILDMNSLDGLMVIFNGQYFYSGKFKEFAEKIINDKKQMIADRARKSGRAA